MLLHGAIESSRDAVVTDFAPHTDVIEARNGDRAAFARLVTRYRGLVSAISLSSVANIATSEDVAQEVFLTAWRDLQSLRNPASFVPWLRQLTRHRALDAARRRQRKHARALNDTAALDAAVDPRPNPHDVMLQDERAEAVRRGLAALPDDARELVILFYREEQSLEHVALLLGLSVDAAKKRLSRARAALRDDVLARLADGIEATAPKDDFTNRVMLGVSPMTPGVGLAVGKSLLPALGKSAAFALAWAWLAGMVTGIASTAWGLRRDLRRAIDQRERYELMIIAAVTIANTILFELGVMSLPPREPATAATRLCLGTGYTLLFVAIHLGIAFIWYPRAKARRRRAEALADPNATERHAREARRARVWVAVACAVVASVIAAAWIRG
ncbi:MAG TPA: sigma-70 family RNA polymerase sigma factor [Polyangiaceae bacterium]|nr:sigma-70 family RNA polymerase sigma factor [Polyangiaceae bacterium]